MQGYSFVLFVGILALSRAQTIQDIAEKFTAQLPVDIRCKTDTTSKLSCGVHFQDQCAEKWNFKNPCTPQNLARNLTMFPHPQANNKFLMCGDFGKLYVVLCPRYEIFHAGCRQCVAQGSKLTTACEVHDIPLAETLLTSNPCTSEAILSGRLFFPFPNDLGKYIHCDAWGKAWEMICTPGEVWDQYKVACVNPELMNPCSQSSKGPGYLFKHPCKPTMYIRCDAELIPYEVPCTGGDIFSESNQVCQSVTFYPVPPKNICGKFIFRFRTYSQAAFQTDANQQLAAGGSNMKVGNDFNTILSVWKETVKQTARGAGSRGAGMGALTPSILDVGGSGSTNRFDMTGSGATGNMIDTGMTFSTGAMDVSMSGPVGNTLDSFSHSTGAASSAGAATDTTNLFSKQGMTTGVGKMSGSIHTGSSGTVGTGPNMAASLKRVGDFSTATGDIGAGIIDSAQARADGAMGTSFGGSSTGVMDGSSAFASGNMAITGGAASSQSIDASGRIDAQFGVGIDTNQAGIGAGTTGIQNTHTGQSIDASGRIDAQFGVGIDTNQAGIGAGATGIQNTQTAITDTGMAGIQHDQTAVAGTSAAGLQNAQTAATDTSGFGTIDPSRNTIVGGFDSIYADVSGGSTSGSAMSGQQSDMSMGLTGNPGPANSASTSVDTSMGTQTSDTGTMTGIDALAKTVAGIIDPSALIPGLDFSSAFSSSAGGTAGSSGPIVEAAAFQSGSSQSIGDVGMSGSVNTGGSVGMGSQDIVSAVGDIHSGNTGTSSGGFDSIGGVGNTGMSTQDVVSISGNFMDGNTGASSSGSFGTDMTSSMGSDMHGTPSFTGEFGGSSFANIPSGTSGTADIATGTGMFDTTGSAGSFMGASVDASATGGSAQTGVNDVAGFAGDFSGGMAGMSGDFMGTGVDTSAPGGSSGMSGNIGVGNPDTTGFSSEFGGGMTGISTSGTSTGTGTSAKMSQTSVVTGNFMDTAVDASATGSSATSDLISGTGNIGLAGSNGGNTGNTPMGSSAGNDITGSMGTGMSDASGFTGGFMDIGVGNSGPGVGSSGTGGNTGTDMTGNMGAGMHSSTVDFGGTSSGASTGVSFSTDMAGSAGMQGSSAGMLGSIGESLGGNTGTSAFGGSGADGTSGMGMQSGTQEIVGSTGSGNFVPGGSGIGIQTNFLDTSAQMIDSSAGQSSGSSGIAADGSSQGVMFDAGVGSMGSTGSHGNFDATFMDTSSAGGMSGGFANTGSVDFGMSGSSGTAGSPGLGDFGAQVDPMGMGQTGSGGAGGSSGGGNTGMHSGTGGGMMNHGADGTIYLNADGTVTGSAAGLGVGGSGGTFNDAMQMGNQAGGNLVQKQDNDPSLFREYTYSGTPHSEPCTHANLIANRTHFKLLNKRQSFIVCNNDGSMFIMQCNGNLVFDVLTRSCYSDGLPPK